MAIALSAVNVAHAENSGFYVGGQIGRGTLELENKTEKLGDFQSLANAKSPAFVSSVNVGYNFKTQFHAPMRTELSFTTRGNPTFSGENEEKESLSVQHKVRTLMLNTYYDIYTGTNFTPFVTAGVGYAFINSAADLHDGNGGFVSSTHTDKNFAYSLGLGASYRFTDSWSTDVMMRSTYNGKFKNQALENLPTKSTTYDFMFGISYNF